MKQAPADVVEYATIRCEGIEETVIHNFSEISDRVVHCTNLLTGNLTNISPKPIFLTVYKHDIQSDLTLIDLPGLTVVDLGRQRKPHSLEFF